MNRSIICAVFVFACLGAHSARADSAVVAQNDLSITVADAPPVPLAVEAAPAPENAVVGPVKSAVRHIGAWIQNNPGWTAFIFITLATMLINSLGKYPKAAGAIAFLRKAIDLAAPFTHTDSPGTWKPPFVTIREGKLALSLSVPPSSLIKVLPPDPPSPIAPALVLVLFAFLPGCCAQLRESIAVHGRADRNSAQITKDAAARLRQIDCDAVCKDSMLRVIDAQADAVLVNPIASCSTCTQRELSNSANGGPVLISGGWGVHRLTVPYAVNAVLVNP